MAVDFMELSENEMIDLRRYAMGEVAVKILSSMNEQDLIVGWTSDDTINYYKIPELKRVNIIRSHEKVREDAAITSLIRRGYLDGGGNHVTYQEKHERSNNLLALVNSMLPDEKKFKNSYYPGGTPENLRHLSSVPWDYTSRLLQVTQAGKQALISMQARVNKITVKEQELKENPRFLIVHPTNRDGEITAGIGGLFRYEKERGDKIWISLPRKTDNIPSADYSFNNNAVQLVTKDYSTIARWVDRKNVLAMNVTVSQYSEMMKIYTEYLKFLKESGQALETAILPFKIKHHEEVSQSRKQMSERIGELVEIAREQAKVTQSALPDLAEEDIALSDSEIDCFKV